MVTLNTLKGDGAPTWSGSRSHQSRIDCIGVSLDVAIFDETTMWVDASVDLAAVRDDHFLLCARLVFPQSAGAKLQIETYVQLEVGSQR